MPAGGITTAEMATDPLSPQRWSGGDQPKPLAAGGMSAGARQHKTSLTTAPRLLKPSREVITRL